MIYSSGQLNDISTNLGVAYNELTQPYQVIEDLDENGAANQTTGDLFSARS